MLNSKEGGPDDWSPERGPNQGGVVVLREPAGPMGRNRKLEFRRE